MDGLFLWCGLPDVQPRVFPMDPRVGVGLQQEKGKGRGRSRQEPSVGGGGQGAGVQMWFRETGRGVEVHRLKLWT